MYFVVNNYYRYSSFTAQDLEVPAEARGERRDVLLRARCREEVRPAPNLRPWPSPLLPASRRGNFGRSVLGWIEADFATNYSAAFFEITKIYTLWHFLSSFSKLFHLKFQLLHRTKLKCGLSC